MQMQIINEYATRLGKKVESFDVNPPRSGKKHLCERDAGGALLVRDRQRDTVIQTRLRSVQ
jgi:hypothetical protein